MFYGITSYVMDTIVLLKGVYGLRMNVILVICASCHNLILFHYTRDIMFAETSELGSLIIQFNGILINLLILGA